MGALRVMDALRAADFSLPELKWLSDPTFPNALQPDGMARRTGPIR